MVDELPSTWAPQRPPDPVLGASSSWRRPAFGRPRWSPTRHRPEQRTSLGWPSRP